MAQIRVNDLSFTYEGSSDPVLSHVTFQIDTNWKLGLIGRNGKGKGVCLCHVTTGEEVNSYEETFLP